jgi:hypothetical protein
LRWLESSDNQTKTKKSGIGLDMTKHQGRLPTNRGSGEEQPGQEYCFLYLYEIYLQNYDTFVTSCGNTLNASELGQVMIFFCDE